MKNLKKSLALVLAIVMVFSLCIFANAAFVDQDKIGAKYEEAASVMNGLGILKGDQNGVFDPQGNLTRGQACKIVAYMKLGATLAEKLTVSAAPFNDVKVTDWAAPFITYCKAQKIVSGYGDGNFGPEDKLTGFQFGKMLLVALGYGKDGEYEGEGWEINVTEDALAVGIYPAATLEGATSELISRELAAQLAFNGLNAPTTTGSALYVVADSDGNVLYVGPDATVAAVMKSTDSHNTLTIANNGSLGSVNYGLSYKTGVVNSTPSTVAGQKFSVVGGDNFATALDASMVGHTVKVWYKAAAAAPATGYVTYSVEDLTTKVVINSTMTAAQVKSAFNAAGVTANLAANSVPVIANGTIGANSPVAVTLGTTAGATIALYAPVTFLVANRAVTGIEGATTYVASKVTAITKNVPGAETITLAGVVAPLANNATSDVVNEYEGIAVGDIVVYSVCGNVYNLVKAETVEGMISKNANGVLTVNGVAYRAFAGTDNSGIADDAADFSNTFVLYLANGQYFGLKIKGSAAVDTTLVYAVAKYEKAEMIPASEYVGASTATLYFVQAVDMTGTVVNYQVKKATYDAFSAGLKKVAVVSGRDSGNAAVAAKAYDYASLEAVAASAAATTKASANTTDTNLTKNLVKVTESGNNYYLNNDMTVLYISGEKATLKVTATTGKVAAETNGIILYGEKSDITSRNYTTKYVIIPAAAPTATTGTGIIFAAEAAVSTTTVPYTQATGLAGTAYEHTVYIDGVKTTILTDTDDAISGVLTYEVETTGLYTMVDEYTSTSSGAVTNNYGGIVSYGSQVDKDLSAATIVNTLAPTDPNYAKVATTAAALTECETITVVYSSTGVATFVYVTAYTPAAN